MSNSSQEIVHEGWLTKSPPSKRIWRAKWRKRWFALRQSGELPGQYFLDYYSDRNCRKLKGRIDLDLCDQVDAGLCMERSTGTALGSSVRGSVFSVRTAARTYHLEAECEEDMQKWVDAICRVCGLRAEQPCSYMEEGSNPAVMGPADITEPYIRISECITGVPGQESARPRAFTFDAQSVIASNNNNKKVTQGQQSDAANVQGSDQESNLTEEERQCLEAVQVNNGPPVPPRPASTFRLVKNGTLTHKEVVGPPRGVKYTSGRHMPSMVWSANTGRGCYANAAPPGQEVPLLRMPCLEDDLFMADDAVCFNQSQSSTQYTNLPMMPPAVDRALKPRHSSHSSSYLHEMYYHGQPGWDGDHGSSPSYRRRADYSNTAWVHRSGGGGGARRGAARADTLQYLDLDLHSPKPTCSKDFPSVSPSHSKSKSASEDPDSAYKTVDFLKTEAFNITRKDAEALRSNAMAL